MGDRLFQAASPWMRAPCLTSVVLPPTPCAVQGQTIACMYLGLTCFIQLSIMLTRNPSFWWHFSKKRCGGGGSRAGRGEATTATGWAANASA